MGKNESNTVKEILDEFRQLDLSTKQGRISVSDPSLLTNGRLRLLSPEDCERVKKTLSSSDRGHTLGTLLSNAVLKNNRRDGVEYLTHEDVSFDTQTILNQWDKIGIFYGHGMAKRADHLSALTGNDKAWELPIEEKCRGNNLLPYLLDISSSSSCDMINCSPGRFFLDSLYRGIENNTITLEEARKHPNYLNVSESMVLADRLNRSELEILMKLYSHKLQDGEFSFLNLDLVENPQKLVDVAHEMGRAEIGLSKWTSIYLQDKFGQGYGSGEKMLEAIREKAKDAVSSKTFCEFIDDETSQRRNHIEFLQSDLDRYNSKIKYSEPGRK
jgi:hypothetical protein